MTLQDWVNKYPSIDELELLKMIIQATKEDK